MYIGTYKWVLAFFSFSRDVANPSRNSALRRRAFAEMRFVIILQIIAKGPTVLAS